MKFLNAATLTTVLRYALQALGGWLVAQGKLEPGAWESISGALLVLVPALLGVFSANTDKVVVNGKVAAVDSLPADTKASVKAVAASKPKRLTFIEQLLGGVFGAK